MHAHKPLHWILGIIGVIIVFFAGFYIGTLDAAYAHKIKVSSQCASISVETSFSANYESIDGQVIRNEKNKSEKYTAQCLCFASDATHKNIWVDTVELSGNNENDVRFACDNDCQTLCEERLTGFVFAE